VTKASGRHAASPRGACRKRARPYREHCDRRVRASAVGWHEPHTPKPRARPMRWKDRPVV